MEDLKFIKPLILGLVLVVLVCLGVAVSYNSDKATEEEKAEIENEFDMKTYGKDWEIEDLLEALNEEFDEDEYDYSAPIDVDENGVPTKKGQEQLKEMEERLANKEVLKSYGEGLVRAYFNYMEATDGGGEAYEGPSGANGSMDL